MQRKRLRFWIIFGAIFLVIISIFLILAFCFRLKTVDVEFQSRLSQSETRLSQGVQETVKGYFPYKENVILMTFDDTITKIEKDIPFIKINQVIKSFPNIVRVYVSERIPKYRVKYSVSSDWLILDEDFKVLDKITNSDLHTDDLYINASYFEKTVEISSQTLSVTANIGDFINNNEIKELVNKISTGVYGRTEDYLSVNSISITKENEEYKINIVMRNVAIENGEGCNIVIEGIDNLETKVFVGISTFQAEIQADSTINTQATTIKIYYSNGEYKGIKVVN